MQRQKLHSLCCFKDTHTHAAPQGVLYSKTAWAGADTAQLASYHLIDNHSELLLTGYKPTFLIFAVDCDTYGA